MEAAAHDGGVGEGLELADELEGGGLGFSLNTAEPGFGGADGESVLVGEALKVEPGGLSGAAQAGEIDVGGDVGFSNGGVGILVGLVFPVAAEGACRAGRGVVGVGLVAVVDHGDGAAAEDAGGVGDPLVGSEINFGGVSRRDGADFQNGVGQSGGVDGFCDLAEVAGDVDFLPLLAVEADAVNGKGVQQFVAEENGIDGFDGVERADDFALLCKSGEA